MAMLTACWGTVQWLCIGGGTVPILESARSYSEDERLGSKLLCISKAAHAQHTA